MWLLKVPIQIVNHFTPFDLFLGMARQFFKVYMEACKLGPNNSHIPDHLMMHDPQIVKDVIHFKKKQKGLVDVEFKAWNLKIGGLHNLKIENLHVVRHIGLKDIRYG